MPARSKKQMKKMFVLEEQGKVKPGTAEEFAVKGKAYDRLPDYAPKPAKPRKK